jgi:uncharacterized membrane protein
MPPILLEWSNLAVRWIHAIAAIMWIGDSFLFMWMDSHLKPPSRPREGAVAGELWMVHSGGFYEVVKRRFLAPNELPETLHWFKWEAYATWISGFFLLGIVYFLGGGVYLVDPAVSGLSHGQAVGLSVALLVAGWFVYDALWMSPLARRPRVAAAVSYALIVAAAWGLTRVYSGRAAFIQLGAMIGTVMVANVKFRIIPAQNQMLAATRAGATVDVSLGQRAKQRSTHNHYVTLPVLFTMLGNHFPSAYGPPAAWLILTLVIAFGVIAKYVMNARGRSDRRVLAAGLAIVVTLAVLTSRPGPSLPIPTELQGQPPVAFATAHTILQNRCITCHAAQPTHPSFPQAPSGVILEDPRRIRSLAPRILVRAVLTETMPLANLTGMTPEERRLLGAWIVQGAKVTDDSP